MRSQKKFPSMMPKPSLIGIGGISQGMMQMAMSDENEVRAAMQIAIDGDIDVVKNGIIGIQEVSGNLMLKQACEVLVDQKFILLKILVIRSNWETFYTEEYDSLKEYSLV